MDQLDGKVMVVTGAARGLGEVVARLAVQRGAKVVMVDVRDELGEFVAGELGDGAVYRHCDVRDEQDWATAVSTAESAFGGLDVLVNNAAVLRLGLLEDFALEDFKAL